MQVVSLLYSGTAAVPVQRRCRFRLPAQLQACTNSAHGCLPFWWSAGDATASLGPPANQPAGVPAAAYPPVKLEPAPGAAPGVGIVLAPGASDSSWAASKGMQGLWAQLRRGGQTGLGAAALARKVTAAACVAICKQHVPDLPHMLCVEQTG